MATLKRWQTAQTSTVGSNWAQWIMHWCLISGLHLELLSVRMLTRSVIVDQDANPAVIAPLTLVLLGLRPDELF